MVQNATDTVKSVLSWQWTKQLLYWIVMSGGTVSECAFLIASIWMSINSSVHPLVLTVMSEQTTIHISQIATAGYVALPECIVGLAVVTVIAHVRMWIYTHQKTAIVWSVLYGIPTLVFIVLSLVTLGCSVASTTFIMPEPFVIVRALAGYMFAFTSLLHAQLEIPQERDRLQKKDNLLAALHHDNQVNLDNLKAEKDGIIDRLNHDNQVLINQLQEYNLVIEKQKELLADFKNTQQQLINTVNKSDDMALQAYSEECLNWLKSGVKTVNVDDITRFTGISKRKIDTAITKGSLLLAPRNRDLILVSSLVSWLKTMQPSTGKTEEIPLLHLVNER